MTRMAAEPESSEPPVPLESDESLMARLRAGERPPFDRLLDRHLAAVTGFSYRMLGDAAEAEDVAQETFLRLWRHRQTGAPGLSFARGCSGWPGTCAATGFAGGRL